jgi:hypothetical protein
MARPAVMVAIKTIRSAEFLVALVPQLSAKLPGGSSFDDVGRYDVGFASGVSFVRLLG